jgi:hypothetical protein
VEEFGLKNSTSSWAFHGASNDVTMQHLTDSHYGEKGIANDTP